MVEWVCTRVHTHRKTFLSVPGPLTGPEANLPSREAPWRCPAFQGSGSRKGESFHPFRSQLAVVNSVQLSAALRKLPG